MFKSYLRRKISGYLIVSMLFALLVPAASAGATPSVIISKVYESSTFNTSNFKVNNNTQLTGGATGVKLTPSNSSYGSAFTKNPVTLAADKKFSMYAKITSSTAYDDFGDTQYHLDGGYVFVLQSNGNTSVGNSASSLGYNGLANSIAVAIDTENNMIKIWKNGSTTLLASQSISQYTVSGSGTFIRHLWVDYDGLIWQSVLQIQTFDLAALI